MDTAIQVAGPALFGLLAGAMYGYTTSAMRQSLPAHTRGWTATGKRFRCSRYVIAHGDAAVAFLTLADESSLGEMRLREAMSHLEQALACAAHVEAMSDDAVRRDGFRMIHFVGIQSDLLGKVLRAAQADMREPLSEACFGAVRVIEDVAEQCAFNVRAKVESTL